MAISMLKIRRPLGRLIFNMGIAIPGKTVFLIETARWLRQFQFINNSLLHHMHGGNGYESPSVARTHTHKLNATSIESSTDNVINDMP